MNWALWMSGTRGPELAVLVDRGDAAPLLTDYEKQHALGAPIKLAPLEQWLRIDVLRKLYPQPAADQKPAPKPPAPKPPGA